MSAESIVATAYETPPSETNRATQAPASTAMACGESASWVDLRVSQWPSPFATAPGPVRVAAPPLRRNASCTQGARAGAPAGRRSHPERRSRERNQARRSAGPHRTERWGNVLQSGRKWGRVATSTDRSGGAPPTPPLRSELLLRDMTQLAFRGHFEHSLDAKNRLSIPADSARPSPTALVLAKDPEPCVAVWTPEAHEAIIERALGELNPMGSRVPQAAAASTRATRSRSSSTRPAA